MSNRIEPLRLLLALGADPSNPDAGGWTALLFAVAGSGTDEILDALLEAGADPKVTHASSGLTPLEGAARNSNAYAISQLITHGADPNAVLPGRLLLPLYYAIEEQSEDCVRALLANGADARFRFEGDWTPMLYAVQKGNIDIVRQLRAAGASIGDICKPEGWSALHLAAKEGHRVTVRWLLDEGVDSKKRDADGKIALDYADAGGHLTIASILRRV
jgi:ankyrin repeat protein